MAKLSEQFVWGTKRMKRLVFALTGVAALTLAACGSSNQDQVSNAELNQPSADLNEQANEAANECRGGRRARQPAGAAQPRECGATENATNPSDAQEQNVSGM